MQNITDGTFTVVYQSGAHRTLRLETPTEGKWKGVTILSILVGPDNETSYLGCGTVNPQTGLVKFWHKFASRLENAANDGRRLRRVQFAVNTIFRDPMAAGEAYALSSGRCFHCDRKLTVPASIHRGLGPICAAKYGANYEAPEATPTASVAPAPEFQKREHLRAFQAQQTAAPSATSERRAGRITGTYDPVIGF